MFDLALRPLRPGRAFAVYATFALLVPACSSDTSEDGATDPCAGLADSACRARGGCGWSAASEACQVVGIDAGWQPCPSDCSSSECASVTVGDLEFCIVKPDCEDLDETSCGTTLGCEAVKGDQVTLNAPGLQATYAGCATSDGSPGSMITCTAQGPAGPCWYLGDTRLPDGWAGWTCIYPKTFENCIQHATF